MILGVLREQGCEAAMKKVQEFGFNFSVGAFGGVKGGIKGVLGSVVFIFAKLAVAHNNT